MSLEITTDAEQVIQLVDDPTRAFECMDLEGNVVCVLLVGDPVKPPRHYTHDFRAAAWPEVQRERDRTLNRWKARKTTSHDPV